nr:O-acyltransferase WSD1-like [Tanacetum cinerariifolium]
MVLKVNIGVVEDVEMSEPVSPIAQYFNSSTLSVSIIGILEFENPFDDSSSLTLINNVFLPINPRFSSIMVEDGEGEKHWKRVEVKAQDHLKLAHFPEGLSVESYDHYFDDYLSKIAMVPLPQTRPLWEIHIIKYPTSNASSSLVFKLHHALGDGYSLMGALLSCLQRADNPSLPLTFPNIKKSPKVDNEPKSLINALPKALSGALNTVLDFGWSILKSSFLEDSRTSIRSGNDGVEFQPINIMTMTFSLDKIKQIKSKLHVTINDVVTGMIFLGTRLYMEETNEETKNAKSTAIVVLNTRSIGGYKSVDEMLQNQEAQDLWGNKFAFLHISLPVLNEDDHSLNPLKFVQEVQSVIKRKRNSSTVYLNGMLLDSVRKYRGPEATAEYIHSTLKNSSMGMSNMIGPLEKMALANQPVKGLYFMPVNLPLSLTVTIMSYMDQLRVAVGTEKGLISPVKFSAHTQKAFNMIFNAAVIYFRTSGGGALCMLPESMWYEAIPVNGYFTESCSYGSALGIMGPKYVPKLMTHLDHIVNALISDRVPEGATNEVKPDLMRPLNDYMFSPIIQLAQPDQFTIFTSLLAIFTSLLANAMKNHLQVSRVTVRAKETVEAAGTSELQPPTWIFIDYVVVSRVTVRAKETVEAAGGFVRKFYYNLLCFRALLKPEWFEKKGRLIPKAARLPPKQMDKVESSAVCQLQQNQSPLLDFADEFYMISKGESQRTLLLIGGWSLLSVASVHMKRKSM